MKKYFLLIFLAVACEQADRKSEHDVYNENATELVTQIFSNEAFDCVYVVKPDSNTPMIESIEEIMPRLNIKQRLLGILKVDKESTLDSLISLSRDFEFEQSMFREKTKMISHNDSIIGRFTFSIFEKITDEEFETIMNECPNEICFVSKPIFNKSYTIAVIDVYIPVGCLRSAPEVYHLKDGKWVLD